jgi:peptide/nickel transport system substrate-binding protein
MNRLLSRRGRGHIVRFLIPAAVLLILSGILPAANAHATPAHRSAFKVGGTVIIDNVSGSLWTCGFNPYGASTADLAAGIIYEPLWYINQLTNAQRPWLATSYAWSNNNKTLSFTIRKNVKWSNGKPLTPADVVFTFKLMKRFPGLDLQAVWTVLSGVSAQGDKVIFSFKQQAVPFFFYIADQNFILPQHIWSKVKNPVTFTDPHPVGTGPFLLKSCSPQDITYVRNPHFWQPGKPYVSEVRYPAFLDNQPGNQFLQQGKANWGGQFIPNISTYYLSAGPNRHNWDPPAGADVSLYLNLTKYPLNILAVRKAISLGLDRSTISRLGVYGYLPPANQSGIILPTWKSWYDSSLASKYSYGFQPARAISLLKQAGFKRGSNGIFHDSKGRALSLQILDNQGYTDWIAENQIIRQDLKSIGIDVIDLNISGNDQVSRLGTGNFQAAYYSPTGGPLPYYQYRQLLHSANSAPIGQTASSNYERFHSNVVDGLLNQYARTTSSSLQHTIINKLQQVMLSQVPIIPVLEGVDWFQYDTSQIVGWPTPQNPYAAPSPYNYPDWEVTLTTVHAK